MKLFLSFSSKQRDAADRMHAALSVRGHEVFFDAETLSAGREFNEPIRRAIEDADILIFLVSPDSVENGVAIGFPATELKIRRRKRPNPMGSLLPVMIVPTQVRDLDPYLAAVKPLYPKGDISAEVVLEIEEMGALLHPSERSGGMGRPSEPELLAQQRIGVYKKLWELTDVLPKWPIADGVEYPALLEFSQRLRHWYFCEGAGMFLSRAAHSAYSALQTGITAVSSQNRSGPITAEHYEEVRVLCSALRSQMVRDIGTRW